MDDRAGRQKQQGFEERMGHQMENRGRVGADAGAEEHIAELADRRIGEHPLDVVLHEADRRGKERRGAADHADDTQGDGGEIENEMVAHDHVDAGRDHRGGMDERADGRGALHRIRQPRIERNLRRFADGPHQEA